MAENLFCDSCGQPADVFGFTQGVKTKSCSDHALKLVDKGVSTYSITAFHFISTPRDVPVFEQRRALMQKGLNAVAMLEAQCERDWETEEARIKTHSAQLFAVLERGYREIWLRVKDQHDAIRQSLTDARSRFAMLLHDRNYELSQEDVLLSEREQSPALFKVVLGDCRVPLIRTLLSSFDLITQESALHVAGQSDTDGPDTANKDLFFLLPNTAPSADTQYWLTTYEEHTAVACSRGEFAAAIAELQDGRRRAMHHTDLRLRLSNELAQVYTQAALFAELIEQCPAPLRTRSPSYEQLRAVYFHANAQFALQKSGPGLELARQWESVAIQDQRCQCMHLCLQARRRQVEGSDDVRLSEEAASLAEQILPRTYATASSQYQLGAVHGKAGRNAQAIECYRRACGVFKACFPQAYDFARCLNNLGNAYSALLQLAEAEATLAHAHALLARNFANSLPFGVCLYNIGMLCDVKGMKKEAVQRLEDALKFFTKKGDLIYAEKCKDALKPLRSKWF